MPTYEYQFTCDGGGFFSESDMYIGTIEWPNSSDTLTHVNAKMTSGNATVNFHVGDPKYPENLVKTFQENLNIRWHLRARDLGAVTPGNSGPSPQYGVTTGTTCQLWRSCDKSLGNFRNTSSTVSPSWENNKGIYDGGSTNKYGAVYFDGSEYLHNYSGSKSVPYNQSFSIVGVFGDVTAADESPILGQDVGSASDPGSIWGDYNGKYTMRKTDGRKVETGSGIMADNQIRVATVEYNSGQDRYYINEWVNGTLTINNQVIKNGGNTDSWVFDMIAANDYDGGVDEFYTGSITEMMFLDSLLDTDTRQMIEGVMAHQYEAESLLVSGHPYKSTNPLSQSWYLGTDLTLASTYGTDISLASETGGTISLGKRSTLSFAFTRCDNPGQVTLKFVTS